MSEKTGPELELDKIVEGGDLGKEENNVTNIESSVAISEQKEQNVVEEIPSLSCRDEENVEVNIIGNSGFKGVEDNCVDLTVTESSSSSSFGHTDTSSDSAFGDSEEVESQRRHKVWRQPLLLRKKKLTDHWRRYIFPIMWRSKWIELKIKKLNSQAQKYIEEIAAIDQQKQFDFLKFAVDNFGVNVFCFDPNLFSLFCCPENKNQAHDGPVEGFHDDVVGNADNIGEIKLNDMWSSVDHQKDNDKSFVDMIENVEALLSQVENLKTRIDTVKNENPGKFCSATQSNIVGQSNGFNRSVHNSASFAGKEIPVPGSFAGKSELFAEDQLMTDNALSTREGITPSIESANRNQFEVQGENVEEKSNESVEEKKSISRDQVSDSDMVTENAVPNAHSIKPCSTSKTHFPRNTRRVRRKFGP
ncbi:hypothetical protein MTR_7g007590 [Medicago truncatula]|uniref:Uncharacterized protein n=1 Tax=Medicago truncatula TaxID=3880 RepID=A0A072TWI3_MEDTR|nr:hypothetical protein MTR_7g007590 [Medicago truncatula]